jgi:hypothetical protein
VVDKYLLALLLQLVELEASGALGQAPAAAVATPSTGTAAAAANGAAEGAPGSSKASSGSGSKGGGSLLLPVAEDALKMGQVAQRVRGLVRLVNDNLVK